MTCLPAIQPACHPGKSGRPQVAPTTSFQRQPAPEIVGRPAVALIHRASLVGIEARLLHRSDPSSSALHPDELQEIQDAEDTQQEQVRRQVDRQRSRRRRDRNDDMIPRPARRRTPMPSPRPFPPTRTSPASTGRPSGSPRRGVTAEPPDLETTGSTLTEAVPSDKTGTQARPGFNPGNEPLDRVRVDSGGQRADDQLRACRSPTTRTR